MGLFKRLGFSGRATASTSEPKADDYPDETLQQQTRKASRQKSVISLVPLSEVTDESLKIFRQLPGTIRHDPSMISFQTENERWKGENCLVTLLSRVSILLSN